MILRKNKTDTSVLFIDASKEYVKSGNKNKMTDENIESIFQLYSGRIEKPYISRLVPYSEISSEKNNYNLSVSTYVEQEDTREKIDIVKLNAELEVLEERNAQLRVSIRELIKSL